MLQENILQLQATHEHSRNQLMMASLKKYTAVVLLPKLSVTDLTNKCAAKESLGLHSLELCKKQLESWELSEQKPAFLEPRSSVKTELSDVTIKNEPLDYNLDNFFIPSEVPHDFLGFNEQDLADNKEILLNLLDAARSYDRLPYTGTLNKENHCNNASATIAQLELSGFGSNISEYKPFACPYCSFRCCLKSSLRLHLGDHDTYKNGIYRCTTCTFQTKILPRFYRHMNSHKDEMISPADIPVKIEREDTTTVTEQKTLKQILICPTCSHESKCKQDLQQHMDIHNEASNILFKCPLCSHRTRNPRSLRMHMLVHEPKREKSFKCKHCVYCSDVYSNYKRHLRVHMVNRDKCFSCSECSFKTDIKGSLEQHLLTHFADLVPKKYSCELCSYQTRNRTHLMRHANVHIFRKQEFSCNLCSYQTDNEKSLLSHLRIHDPNRELRFSCKQCDYKSDFFANLQRHTRYRHEQQEKIYSCQFCGHKTDCQTKLRNHAKRHDPNRPKPLACNDCSYRTDKKVLIKYHSLRHQPKGEKNLVCSFCHYRTDSKLLLRIHTNKNHKDKSQAVKATTEFVKILLRNSSYLQNEN